MYSVSEDAETLLYLNYVM